MGDGGPGCTAETKTETSGLGHGGAGPSPDSASDPAFDLSPQPTPLSGAAHCHNFTQNTVPALGTAYSGGHATHTAVS